MYSLSSFIVALETGLNVGKSFVLLTLIEYVFCTVPPLPSSTFINTELGLPTFVTSPFAGVPPNTPVDELSVNQPGLPLTKL